MKPIAPPAPGHQTALHECHDCGLFLRLGTAVAGSTVRCPRCGAVIRRVRKDPIDVSLAMAAAGLALFAVSTFMPFMTLNIAGQNVTGNLFTGPQSLYAQGLWELALVVAFTTLVAPAVKLFSTIYMLACLRHPRPPAHVRALMRLKERISPWAMAEVYLLGVFVAYTKLVDMAMVHIGAALAAFFGVMLAIVMSDAALDEEAAWDIIDRRVPAPAGAARRLDAPEPGAVGCHCCGLVSQPSTGRHRCPRCGDALHRRKPNSLARTWALTLAAAVLYLPANIYPVMTVISMGQGAPDTILSGVVELVHSGMWPLALLVFFASITVPVLKLLGIVLMLVTTQMGSAWRLRDRTVLYRIVEFVGRWSMIDIFMISILVGLVKLGRIATIAPGVGAVSFAAVVILTMFAAECFDPRLMWDAAARKRARTIASATT